MEEFKTRQIYTDKDQLNFGTYTTEQYYKLVATFSTKLLKAYFKAITTVGDPEDSDFYNIVSDMVFYEFWKYKNKKIN